jgi:NAD(P)-dependent dehydrogenase (short-subunit alcohol dehydrogenase family)
MNEQLEGRRIVITGAATGIGAAAVKVLGAEGATVTGTFRETKPAPDSLGLASWVQCDLSREAEADRGIDEAVSLMGGIDVLIHAAGRWEAGHPGEITGAHLDSMLATNLKATVFANQAAFRHMKAGGGGRIVNFGSGEGISGMTLSAGYATAKGAVHSWTRSAAKAWGSYEITVNAILPAVESPGADRYRGVIGPEGTVAMGERLSQMRPIASSFGPPAMGDPVTDLGPMLVFLASVGSRFVTGQLLAVDGGIFMLGA